MEYLISAERGLKQHLKGAPMPAPAPPPINMSPEEYTPPEPERKTIPAIDTTAGGWIGARPNWWGNHSSAGFARDYCEKHATLKLCKDRNLK
jgi:hypothetical protein